MQNFHYYDKPLEVHGLPFWDQNHRLERIPDEDVVKFPLLTQLSKRCPGCRICFRTDAKRFTVKLTLETLTPHIGQSLFTGQSLNVMIGERKNAVFAGIVCPSDYSSRIGEKTFTKSSETEDITVFLPRLEKIADIEITVDDNAVVSPPTPYKYPPMLYYGSSITEGGISSRVTNTYNALISSMLDVDYYNFGFSGSAMGEPEMAELIGRIPMSAFVLDYDHNAPDIKHLSNTHEPFFKLVRKNNPTLPIIMITRPVYRANFDADKSADIIYRTYKNAVDAGDSNVWFIDGRSFFGEFSALCSVDDCHPNDFGFYIMAQKIAPVVREALEKNTNDIKR